MARRLSFPKIQISHKMQHFFFLPASVQYTDNHYIFPISAFNCPYTTCLRYFDANTIWYLQFHFECDKLWLSFIWQSYFWYSVVAKPTFYYITGGLFTKVFYSTASSGGLFLLKLQKNKPHNNAVWKDYGRGDRTRTCGILLPKQARYHLRYTSIFLYQLFSCISVFFLLCPPSCGSRNLFGSIMSLDIPTAAPKNARFFCHRQRSRFLPKAGALPPALHLDTAIIWIQLKYYSIINSSCQLLQFDFHLWLLGYQ